MTLQSRAHVIIPTLSAHDTLTFAVLSAVNQSLRPNRITIIGDGATARVREVAQNLAKKFSEVEFLDKPKLKNRGEKYRDEVIKASDSDFISYLCDDDLYMPNHLEVMSKHLEQYDFVHPMPTFVNPDGTVFFIPSGIEIPKIRSWHRSDSRQNTVSLTGASHTRQSYLSLEQGWDAGPPEYFTDLYMWTKFFASENLRTYTSPLTTTIKLVYTKSQRDLLSREDSIKEWYDVTLQADKLASFQNRIERQLKETFFDYSVGLTSLHAVIAERDAILSSNAWRITKPLRTLGNMLKVLLNSFVKSTNSDRP